MAITFKAMERGEPGVAGSGQKMFYATAVSNGESALTIWLMRMKL